MHAARRSLIKALMVLKYFNHNVDMDSRDHVAIVNFDFFNASTGEIPQILQTFNGDYDQVMKICMLIFKPWTDKGSSTALEPGLRTAYNYMDQNSRDFADKVVVNLDRWKSESNLYQPHRAGQPIRRLSDRSIANKTREVKDAEDQRLFYRPRDPKLYQPGPYGHYLYNAAFMQTHKMAEDEWHVYAVGLGYGVNDDFIDRLAKLGKTEELEAENIVKGTPQQVEEGLTKVFKAIVLRPRVVLVD